MRGSAVNINLLHLNANYSHSDLKRRGTSIFLRQRRGVHPMDPDLPLTKLWTSWELGSRSPLLWSRVAPRSRPGRSVWTERTNLREVLADVLLSQFAT